MIPPVGSPELSVIVTAHNEGALLHRTLRSVDASLSLLKGVPTEVAVVADKPDDATDRYLAVAERAGRLVHRVGAGGAGAARNAGLQLARGRLVAMVDGDDLLSHRWLSLAVNLLRAAPPDNTIAHPELVLSFGDQEVLATHFSSDDPFVDPFELAELNLWTTTVVATRELLLRVPFQEPVQTGAFHEDWHWCCEVIAAGASFRVVPQSCYFYRRRGGSLMDSRAEALFMASSLFSVSSVDRMTERGTAAPRAGARTAARRPPVADRALTAGRSFVLRHPAARPAALATYRLLRRAAGKSGMSRLPSWLATELRAIHDVEPRLWAGREWSTAIPWKARARTGLHEILRQMLSATREPPTHVIAVPWLVRGGADLEALNYARALHEAALRPVVITTEDTPSPWLSRLPAGVSRIELGRLARGLEHQARQQLFAVYLIQSGASRLHILNSHLAYEALSRFAPPMLADCRLYLSVFSEGIDREGRRFGFATAQVPDWAPRATAVIADNRRVLGWLRDRFALDDKNLFAHYHPAPVPIRAHTRSQSRDFRVLWAGRFDRERRPDVMLRVAAAMRHLPVRFMVYGYGLLDPVVTDREMSSHRNVEARGRYDSFENLPLDQFDAFLNTSQWDGMPNVLLEAMASGLPVVSSNVGGIPELVRDGDTGLLVSPFDNVAAYVQALEALREDPGLGTRLAGSARRLIEERHTWSAFRVNLADIPGYL